MVRIGAIVVILSIFSFASYTEAHTEITSPPSSEQPQYLQVGQKLELKCMDTDGSDVQWYKIELKDDGQTTEDKIDVDADSGFDTTYKKENNDGHLVTYSTLVKKEVHMSDSSIYECRPETLNKNPDSPSPSHRMTVEVFEITGSDVKLDTKGSIVLRCNVEGVTSYDLFWYRDKELIKSEKGKYMTDARNNTLTIENPTRKSAGAYECLMSMTTGSNYSHTVSITSPPYVSLFDKSKNLVEGETLTLECDSSGWPTPSISWLKRDVDEFTEHPIESSDRVSFSKFKEIENATLSITNMGFNDRAYYTCTIINERGSSNSTILIRVKDKLAALWPFLGICAEVTILCVIIFIYEKRRAKKMEEEDTPEEAGHLTNSHDHKGNDDIRQRK